MSKSISNNSLFKEIKNILHNAKNRVIQTVNNTMTLTYFEIWKLIVENEQKGNLKAEYGAKTLNNLSKELTKEFGTWFTKRNLELMRQFYIVYWKTNTLSSHLIKNQKTSIKAKDFSLSWSHYVLLMRLDDNERKFYEIESIKNNWSLRELQRQFDSWLYERLALSKNKDEVKILSQKWQLVSKPQDIVKDPYVLEFLWIEESHKYSESQLEQKLIDNLQHFLLELGKWFTFVGRQQRFTFDEEHFFVDLVFYNRLLKCFVIFDLKIWKLKHQDLWQIQMYVNYYDRFIKTKEENPTIWIVLCKDKNNTLVEITLPKGNNQIYASKYKLYLPTKKELKNQIENL